MSPRNITGLAVATALLAAAPASQAQTFSFTAVVDKLDVISPGQGTNIGLVAGNTLTGTITFDRTTPDYDPANPDLGVYYNSSGPTQSPGLYFSTLTLDLPNGPMVFGVKPATSYGRFIEPSVIRVADGATLISPTAEFGTLSGDSLDFYHNIDDTLVGSYTLNRVDRVGFLLNDSSGTAFSSDGLPTTLDLANFDLAKLYYYKSSGTSLGPNTSYLTTEAITATITSLTAVPEPSTIMLVPLALAPLLVRRRRIA